MEEKTINKVDYFTCKVIGGTLPWKKSDFLVHLFNLSLYTVSSIYQTGEPALAEMEEEGGGRREEEGDGLEFKYGTMRMSCDTPSFQSDE